MARIVFQRRSIAKKLLLSVVFPLLLCLAATELFSAAPNMIRIGQVSAGQAAPAQAAPDQTARTRVTLSSSPPEQAAPDHAAEARTLPEQPAPARAAQTQITLSLSSPEQTPAAQPTPEQTPQAQPAQEQAPEAQPAPEQPTPEQTPAAQPAAPAQAPEARIIEGQVTPSGYTVPRREIVNAPVPTEVSGEMAVSSVPIPSDSASMGASSAPIGALSTQSRQPQDTGGGELLGIVPGKTAIADLSNHPIFSAAIAQETVGPYLIATYKVPDIPELTSILLYVRVGIVEGMVVNFASPRTLIDARNSFADVIGGIAPLTILDTNGFFREVYPEKGFAFVLEKNTASPDTPSSNVTQIAVEKVQPGYFLSRASQNLLRNSYERSLTQVCSDAETVLKLQPRSAAAHGLLAQAAFILEEYEVARYQLQEAIAIDSESAQYPLLMLNVYDKTDQGEEGLGYLRAHREVCEKTPFSKAETAILEGDFLRMRFDPDFDGAIQAHRSAVDQLLPLSKESTPGARVLAKRLLIRAYLALALDIVQKPWPEPADAEKAFLWVDTAEKLSDELSSGEPTPVDEVPIDGILNIALAASQVGLFLPESDKIDPYIERVMNIGEITSEQVGDALGLQAIYWNCAKFYRNCWNIAEMREDEEAVIAFARLTLKYLEPFCNEAPDRVADVFGQIDYDLAAVFAGRDDCRTPMLRCRERAIRGIESNRKNRTLYEKGEDGIRLVNFGKAYWVEGDRQRGYDLTRRGIDLIDAAIAASAMDADELIVPLRNAAMMAKVLRKTDDAALYAEQAKKLTEPAGVPIVVPDEDDARTSAARAITAGKPAVTAVTPSRKKTTAAQTEESARESVAARRKSFMEEEMPWEKENQKAAAADGGDDPNRIPLTALISKKQKGQK